MAGRSPSSRLHPPPGRSAPLPPGSSSPDAAHPAGDAEPSASPACRQRDGSGGRERGLGRLARPGDPVRIPETEPAEKRVLVVAATAAGRQLVELVDTAAAEHDLVRLDGRDEPVDRVEDGT